jgi:hypothetical protein
MRRYLPHLGATCLLWLILPILAPELGYAWASDINFKNNTQVTLVVQGATYLNKQKTLIKAGKALQVKPGQMVTDQDVPPGIRLIIITDGLTRVLYRREIIVTGAGDLNLNIEPVPGSGNPPRAVQVVQPKPNPNN